MGCLRSFWQFKKRKNLAQDDQNWHQPSLNCQQTFVVVVVVFKHGIAEVVSGYT